MELARADFEVDSANRKTPEDAARNKVVELERQLKIAERRMATEESDVRYKAIAGQCDETRVELVEAQRRLEEAKQISRTRGTIEERLMQPCR